MNQSTWLYMANGPAEQGPSKDCTGTDRQPQDGGRYRRRVCYGYRIGTVAFSGLIVLIVTGLTLLVSVAFACQDPDPPSYWWDPGPQIGLRFRDWFTIPPSDPRQYVWRYSGENYLADCPTSDTDVLVEYGPGLLTLVYYPLDTVHLSFAVTSEIGSTVDNMSGLYTAGKNWHHGMSGVDTYHVYSDDTPDPMSPPGGGSRDDGGVTITRPIHVLFPDSINESGSELALGSKNAWSQTVHWVVLDQEGNGLDGVGIAENPVTLCTSQPGHDTTKHLASLGISLGSATTHDGGKFDDVFSVGPDIGTGRAATTDQHYTVTCGTYTASNLLEYIVKMIHWRDGTPQAKLTLTPSNTWTSGQKLCTTNE